MVTISVFCNLKEPLLVRFIIIAHTVINHNKSDFSEISVRITLTLTILLILCPLIALTVTYYN